VIRSVVAGIARTRFPIFLIPGTIAAFRRASATALGTYDAGKVASGHHVREHQLANRDFTRTPQDVLNHATTSSACSSSHSAAGRWGAAARNRPRHLRRRLIIHSACSSIEARDASSVNRGCALVEIVEAPNFGARRRTCLSRIRTWSESYNPKRGQT
jgi:hypothetical protein